MAETAQRASAIDLSKRDLTLDLARVSCVLLVVLIHLLMVAIGVDASGQLVATRPLEAQPWFALATWAGQVMPLFFVVGGFASITAWRSAVRRGSTATDYVRSRVLRLARPALPLYAFFLVVTGTATLIGLDPALVEMAVSGAGTPLWFLAAYTLCQAVVPLMAGWHARAPLAVLVVLLAAVVLVDAARFATGVPEVGLFNLFFVWVLVQQFGFWYADGWLDRRHPLTLVGIAVLAYASLVPLTTLGPYSPDMLYNLNPATLPLVVLAVAQACILRLLRPALAKLMETTVARAVVFLVGARLMSIYLWHLPVILAVTGLALLIPGAAPEPGSAAWWWSRIPYFFVVLLAVYGLSFLVGRWEASRDVGPTPPTWVVVVAVAFAFVPSFLVLQFFMDLPLALVGTVLLSGVILLIGRAPARASARVPSPAPERRP